MVITILIVGLFAYIFIAISGRKPDTDAAGDDSDGGVSMVLPEARTQEVPESKIQAYQDADYRSRRGSSSSRNIDSMWESLLTEDGSRAGTDDTGVLPVNPGSASQEGRRLTDEELLRKYYGDAAVQPEAESPRPARQSRPSGGGGAAPVVVPVVPQEESVEETASEEVVDAPVESSSGVVHSMRDEMRAARNGQSVNRRQQEASKKVESSAPVRCQFVRDEVLSSGQRVTVRLLDPLVLNGDIIPANSRLTGTCSVGNRLVISFTGYQRDGKLYSLNYVAVDNDGHEGLYCSGIDQGVERAGSQALSTLSGVASGVASTAGGIIGQLASGAVQAGSSIASQNGGLVKASVPSGYTFFIVEKPRY